MIQFSFKILYLLEKEVGKIFKKRKEEAKIKKSIYHVSNWIFSIAMENKKIETKLEKMISKLLNNSESLFLNAAMGVIYSNIEKALCLSLKKEEDFESMKDIIFMCLGICFSKLQKIFFVEENVQKKLKTMKEKNQKLSDKKFPYYLSFLDTKIQKKEESEKIIKSLTRLGFIEDKYMSDYKNILILFNSTDPITDHGSELYSD